MEQTQQGLLEDLVAPRRDSDTWTNFPPELNEFFPNVWGFESFDETQVLCSSNPPFLGLTSQTDPNFQYPLINEVLYPIGLEINDNSSYGNDESPHPIPNQENYPSMVKDIGELCVLENYINCSEERENSYKFVGIDQTSLGGERDIRVKKAEGQPSKNLMAERRRRKRLNDRLSMLRSIVPKISKMDRTAILGDTINYMKELLEKIKKLQEDMEVSEDQLTLMGNFKELKPNEVLARNSPKFDVERKNINTRIKICCATKPGLLFSTMHKLEALGLDIQQCVISCFNDFSVQASCLEAMEQRTTISTEDIKQELFRSAGYGGRCL